MRVGIVAEGPADVAVLMNILHGKLGVERKDVLPIRPELTLDETDLAERRRAGYQPPRPGEFSNWALVLEECGQRETLRAFLESPIDDDRLLVVQIDTAEAELKGYDVRRPDPAAADYVATLRALVVARLTALVGPAIARRTRFAVAVEETDAWVLTLFAPGEKDTGLIRNPKKKLELLRETASSTRAKKPQDSRRARGGAAPPGGRRSSFDRALAESEGFRDPEALAACLPRNRSLELFVASLAP